MRRYFSALARELVLSHVEMKVAGNITPAIAPDGTIYSVTMAHNPYASQYAYVVAFHPDLSLKWTASLRDRLDDGYGVLVPIATNPSP